MKSFTGLKAVGYIRFSKDEQSASLEQQKTVLMRWAQDNGVQIIDWLTDDGISGTLREDRRPNLGTLMRWVKKRNDFSLVLCYDLSRFGRFQDQNTYGFYFQQAHDSRKQFYFLQDSVSSKDKDIAKVILRVIAEYGAAEKSRITASGAIRGQVARARRGRCVGGFPPYGFDHLVLDINGKSVEIHRFIKRGPTGSKRRAVWQILDLQGKLIREVVGSPPKQKSDELKLVPGEKGRIEIVEQIFRRYAKDGWGYLRICRELNRSGAPSPLGSKWTKGTIRSILRNPAYLGHAAFNLRSSAKIYRIANRPDELGNDHTKIEQEDFERGKPRWNDKRDQIVVEGAFQSPVPADLVEKANLRLIHVRACKGGTGCEPPGSNPRASRSRALLADFARCGKCGHNLVMHQRRVPTKRTPGVKIERDYVYVCGFVRSGGPEACVPLYVRRERLEDPILDSIRKHFLQVEDEKDWKREMKSIFKGVLDVGFDQGRRLGLEHQRDEAKAKIEAIVRGISTENMSLVDAELTRLREEVKAVEAQIAEIPASERVDVDLDAAVGEMWQMTQDFRLNFEASAPEDRRLMLKPFLHEVVVDPEARVAKVRLKKIPMPEGIETCGGRRVPPPGEPDLADRARRYTTAHKGVMTHLTSQPTPESSCRPLYCMTI